jgi:hypothetical protein
MSLRTLYIKRGQLGEDETNTDRLFGNRTRKWPLPQTSTLTMKGNSFLSQRLSLDSDTVVLHSGTGFGRHGLAVTGRNLGGSMAVYKRFVLINRAKSCSKWPFRSGSPHPDTPGPAPGPGIASYHMAFRRATSSRRSCSQSSSLSLATALLAVSRRLGGLMNPAAMPACRADG